MLTFITKEICRRIFIGIDMMSGIVNSDTRYFKKRLTCVSLVLDIIRIKYECLLFTVPHHSIGDVFRESLILYFPVDINSIHKHIKIKY